MPRSPARLLFLAAALAAGTAAPPPARAGGNPATLSARPPELIGAQWLNAPKGEPITLAGRRGKVTVLHFWTHG